MRHWTLSERLTAAPAAEKFFLKRGPEMAKRGRKKRDRKHSKANHGKRPNS